MKKLTFEPEAYLEQYNLGGLENLTHLIMSQSLFEYEDSDLLKSLSNLEFLRMQYTYYIPKNFFKYSSKLKTLDIDGYLSYVKKEDFDGLRNLTDLKLKLTSDRLGPISFEGGFTFDRLMSLKSLTISHDTLNILPADSLSNLKNLKKIIVFCDDYKSNFTKSFNLPKKLFASLISMKELSLEFFGSKELTEDIFADNFGMLEKLSISGYKESTLPENIFKNIPNITELRIVHNNLKSLPCYIFKNLKKLKILDLSYNKLTELPV